MERIAVMVVDDHQVLRQGLRELINNQPDMQVVGEASDGRAAIAMVQERRPDIMVMDIAMPGLNGIEATRQISGQAPDVRIITLSMFSDRRYVNEMLKAGAKGYLLKDSAFEELVN